MNQKLLFGISLLLLINFLSSCSHKSFDWQAYNAPAWEKISDGHKFCEGPAWDGEDGLYVSNCLGGTIEFITPEGKIEFLGADEYPEIHERTNGLTVGADGFVYAAEYGENKGGIIRLDQSGRAESYAATYDGKPFSRPNDLAFDPNGHLYFTNPKGYDAENPDGHIYRVDRNTKEITQVAGPFSFPNGIAFSRDAKKLYVAESAKKHVLILDVMNDGTLTNQRVFAKMPGGDPDGIAIDQKGNVYVPQFGGSHIWIFDSQGELLSKIPTPGSKPSNIEFMGEDLSTMVVTEDETNSVYQIPAPIPGNPLFFHPARN